MERSPRLAPPHSSLGSELWAARGPAFSAWVTAALRRGRTPVHPTRRPAQTAQRPGRVNNERIRFYASSTPRPLPGLSTTRAPARATKGHRGGAWPPNRISRAMIRGAVFQGRSPSRLCYTEDIALQRRTRVKLNRVFFPRFRLPGPFPWLWFR